MIEYVSDEKAYIQFRVIVDDRTATNVEILITPDSHVLFLNAIEKVQE